MSNVDIEAKPPREEPVTAVDPTEPTVSDAASAEDGRSADLDASEGAEAEKKAARTARLRAALERLAERRAIRKAARAAAAAAAAESPAARRARAIHEAMAHKRITMVLRAVVETAASDRITIREIVEAFGERAFGFVIILFSLPNCIPAPPGMNSVFGLPVLLFAVQMALGFKKPWLPRFLMDRSFKVETFRKIIDVAEPKLKRVENLCRPRYPGLFNKRGERLIGIFAILLAFSVVLPLPGTNFVPSIALVVIAIAIMQEDGLVLGLGGLIGLAGLAYTTTLGWAIVSFLLYALQRAVGY